MVGFDYLATVIKLLQEAAAGDQQSRSLNNTVIYERRWDAIDRFRKYLTKALPPNLFLTHLVVNGIFSDAEKKSIQKESDNDQMTVFATLQLLKYKKGGWESLVEYLTENKYDGQWVRDLKSRMNPDINDNKKETERKEERNALSSHIHSLGHTSDGKSSVVNRILRDAAFIPTLQINDTIGQPLDDNCNNETKFPSDRNEPNTTRQHFMQYSCNIFNGLRAITRDRLREIEMTIAKLAARHEVYSCAIRLLETLTLACADV